MEKKKQNPDICGGFVVPSVLDHEGVKLGDIIDFRSSMLYVIALIHKDIFFF